MGYKLDRDYSQFALSREDIIWEIRQRCIKEMYTKAQPSADYDEIYAYYKKCKKEGKEPEQVYRRYYLSEEEFKYIEEKYLDLYELVDSFKDDCNIIIRDLKDGCVKDKYIEEHTDDNGNRHPGHRGYEDIPSFNIQLLEYLKSKVPSELAESLSKEISEKVINFVEDRKNFYRFNVDESKFRFSVALTDSPTSNAEEVIKYWKSQGRELEIDPRHHDSNYFWSEENGYLEEDE